MRFLFVTLRRLHDDSLYRNSFYLMASTAVMSAFGFIFWIVNVRFYNTEQIGLATTLFTVTSIISNNSLLGFNNSLVKFIPKSKKVNEEINTGFTVVIFTTILFSISFILLLPIFAPKLLFLREHLYFEILFIIFMVFGSLNNIVDAVFVAYRNTSIVFIKSIIWSLLKLTLPLLFVSFGAWGIFTSVSISTIIAVAFVYSILYLKYNYSPRLQIKRSVLNNLGRYSAGNYIAGLTYAIPILFLPLLIINRLGTNMVAYYYMPMMIANILYIIPQALTRSLFAEGSNNYTEVGNAFSRTLKITTFLLLPSWLFIFFFGKYILLIFGMEYAINGTKFLQLLSISSIFIYINSVGGVLLNLRHRIRQLVRINIIYTITFILLLFLLIDKGLVGVGFAWLLANILMSVIYCFVVFNKESKT